MRLGPRARVRITVAACFAIGLGSSLTPLGGPLSTLAAGGLGMGFGGLFAMLAPYVVDVTAVSVQLIVDAVERRRSHKDRLKLRYVLGPSNAVIAVNEALDAPAFSHSVAICS